MPPRQLAFDFHKSLKLLPFSPSPDHKMLNRTSDTLSDVAAAGNAITSDGAETCLPARPAHDGLCSNSTTHRVPEPETWLCPVCDLRKPSEAFRHHRKDGTPGGKCYACHLAAARDWKRRNHDRNAAHQRKWGAANRQKQGCLNLHRRAIQWGRLLPHSECSECDATVGIEGHHPSYDHPYHTVGYCKDCHEEHHRAIEAGEKSELPIACIHPQWTAAGRAWAEGNHKEG